MQQFKVAHINEQGQDLIIVFVSDTVQALSSQQKSGLLSALQVCATSAGLRGVVVLLWSNGVWCDPRFHPFFASVPYDFLYANINKELTCNNL
jgi:hypothetical protein